MCAETSYKRRITAIDSARGTGLRCARAQPLHVRVGMRFACAAPLIVHEGAKRIVVQVATGQDTMALFSALEYDAT